jgi:ABC-2 type transport system permease protein
MEADVTLRSRLRFVGALVATSLRGSFALRGAFWLQAGFMFLNNLLFFVFWWLLFQQVQWIGGWRIADVMTLYGVVASGFGLGVILAGGVRDLARTIVEGGLDAVLAQPRSPLLFIAGSRSLASGWGDLASGLLFIGLGGQVSPLEAPLVVLAVLASALVFVASGVVFHSLAFWLGSAEELARQLWEFLLMFSLYPQPLFSGALKLVLFTVLPAAFVGYLPAELLRNPSTAALLAVLAGTATYCAIAAAVFSAGLRRYASGSRFAMRA